MYRHAQNKMYSRAGSRKLSQHTRAKSVPAANSALNNHNYNGVSDTNNFQRKKSAYAPVEMGLAITMAAMQNRPQSHYMYSNFTKVLKKKIHESELMGEKNSLVKVIWMTN